MACLVETNRISVIIPVYNGGDNYPRCLESIVQCEPAPYEVIIVVDGRDAGEKEHAEKRGFRTIVLDRRGGPARARNVGAEAASGEVLLFLDADVTVEKDIIQVVDKLFREDTQLSALFGSYNNRPAAPNLLSQYRNLLHHYVHQNSREDASTFWGACGAVRRSVFLEIGGFDQRYRRPSIEDIEFGYRLRVRGHRIHLAKALQVTHLKRWTFRSIILTDIRDRAIPWTELLLSCPGFLDNDLNLSMSARYSSLLVLLLVLAPPVVVFSPWCAAVIPLSMLLLCWLNRHFYGFLRKKLGSAFLFKVIPMHWLYFLYSGVVFALVALRTLASPASVSLHPSSHPHRLWFR